MIPRIGFGYDVHKLEKGLDLIIGSVKIKHSKGCIAHSDGDVLIHAICDALLGASDLNDIGFHFPDTDEKYKNIESSYLLKKTVELIRNKGFEISNIDSTIVLQKPRIRDYIWQMKEKLATTMNINEGQISIKATTSEKLGFEGREEGVSAHAVVLIFDS
ncbi:MAG: 2-C-methyl-D-erythritol 2,4-cyclodiphosphate synthase [Bacteroidota bacterium]|nr:2-C-methyl-D-erythritol 2,4-cyclodiphosphate synthase [Bacteroidota bacterium]